MIDDRMRHRHAAYVIRKSADQDTVNMGYLVTCLMMASARAPTTRWWDSSSGLRR